MIVRAALCVAVCGAFRSPAVRPAHRLRTAPARVLTRGAPRPLSALPPLFDREAPEGETCADREVRLDEESRLLTAPKMAFAFGALALVFLAAEFASNGAEASLRSALNVLPANVLHPQQFLEGVAATVQSLGPLGPLYFAAVYVTAEVLALPAIPLTASAGYLFGAVEGTAVVLFSATIAAGVSFLIGRTLLRPWVENIAAESDQFQAIDKAVAAEGFKIILLLRLSPIFPFALSNYFYGLTAVEFGPYITATLLGFAPGTFLYVYSGEVASIAASADGGGANFPWYVYAAGLCGGAFLASKVTDIATAALEDASPGMIKSDKGT